MVQSNETHILIVDDSEDDAVLVSAQISRELRGAFFERVDNPDHLKNALESRDWDLIICDHAMPRMDSNTAFQIVRASGQDVPFIIYSGRYSESQGVEAMRLGARDFVEKGRAERLLPVVRRELSTRTLRREKEHAEQRAEEVSRYDSLTQLPNRLFLRELAQQALVDASLHGQKVILFFLDIDRFMRINDSFGYPVGDSLMQSIATRLKSLAAGAVVARIGTDEFALLVEQTGSEKAAQRYADRILTRMADPFIVANQEFYLTASIGICLSPDHANDVTTLIKNAESAMRLAKKEGGARYVVYDSAWNEGVSRKVRIEQALRHAIENEELSVVYQPFLDLATGRITGTEALVRWKHPDMGWVSPGEFIPIAEESNQILSIGEWVLKQACVQTKAWQEAGWSDLTVAVNFTALQFRQENLLQRLLPMIAQTGLAPSKLQIEITESIAMTDAAQTIETLRNLSNAGIRLSIDDFGTGYSSLAYLKRFPIHVLKIDKTFVTNVQDDVENQAIVRAIIALARALRLKTLAEGVEKAEEMDFLRAEGCERIQGYFFAKPSDPQFVQPLLQRYNPVNLTPTA